MIAVIICLFLVKSRSWFSFWSLIFEILTMRWRRVSKTSREALVRSMHICPMNWVTLMQNSSSNFKSTRLILPCSISLSILFKYAHSSSAIHLIGFTISIFSSFSISFYYGTMGFVTIVAVAVKKGWSLTWFQSYLFWSDFWSIPSISSLKFADISLGNLTGSWRILGWSCWILVEWKGVLP